MSIMKNNVEGMNKKKTLSSLRKKDMNIPHGVPQVHAIGMICMIYGSHLMMNSLGKNLQASVAKCSMEGTLRNPSSIPWNTVP